MAKDIVKKEAAGLPVHLQGLGTPAAFNEFTTGVVSSFPVISYRGKTWRVRKGGDEQVYLNADGEAVQSLDVVLVRSNPQPSKIFYERKYEEGDESRPRCFSANGLKPDPSVEEPINAVCASCPNNQWGSRITDNGTKTRACSDVRRMVVVFKHQIEEIVSGDRKMDELDVLLLRVPPASLNPLKDYVEKILKPKGIPPFVVITRVGFDTDASYQKFTFKAPRFWSEDEANLLTELRDGEGARRILAESFEHGEGETTEVSKVAGHAAVAPAEAKASASPTPSNKKRVAVEEEEQALGEEEDEIELPKRAGGVEAEAIDPARPTKKKNAAKGTKAKVADEPDFEKMLSSILD